MSTAVTSTAGFARAVPSCVPSRARSSAASDERYPGRAPGAGS